MQSPTRCFVMEIVTIAMELLFKREYDASEDTVLDSSGNITHYAALGAGWKLVGSGCSSVSNGTSKRCSRFHK